MELKKNLILGAVAGIGAGVGALATALIMTNQCHEMMEYNKKENEKIRQENEKIKNELDKINIDVEKAEKAFNVYKEKVTFLNDELVKMNTGTIEAFRELSNKGRQYESAIKETSIKSIEMIKNELKKSLNDAQLEINTKKADALTCITEACVTKTEDITVKMIEQVETDTGRKTVKKKVK